MQFMIKCFVRDLAFLIILFCAPLAALAAPITVPPDLNPGDQYRLVFVTLGTRDGTSTNINDYNAFVTNQALLEPALAALGTTWTAIVSTPAVDAVTNTNTGGTGVPVYKPVYPAFGDTARVADDYSQFRSGGHQTRINVDQFGYYLDFFANATVWTGAFPSALTDFLMGGAHPIVGLADGLGANWIQAGTAPASMQARLYGISGVLTVVPEPDTFVLLGMALAGMIAWRARSRLSWFSGH